LIISDREIFLSNATVIAGGFIFMTLTGLLNSDGPSSVLADRLVLIVVGTFSISSVILLLDLDPRVARGVAVLGYVMLLIFLANFVFNLRGLIP
jgi:hypothetical protein